MSPPNTEYLNPLANRTLEKVQPLVYGTAMGLTAPAPFIISGAEILMAAWFGLQFAANRRVKAFAEKWDEELIMRVAEVMSERPEYLDVNATIREAALHMKNAGRGFTPITKNDKLVGILTDRDIAIRAMAEGKTANEKVSSILTSFVLYCYENDDIADVLQRMQDQEVQRLVVLNNDRNKDVAGVVSLSDIADNCEDDDIGRRIVRACRHYH